MNHLAGWKLIIKYYVCILDEDIITSHNQGLTPFSTQAGMPNITSRILQQVLHHLGIRPVLS